MSKNEKPSTSATDPNSIDSILANNEGFLKEAARLHLMAINAEKALLTPGSEDPEQILNYTTTKGTVQKITRRKLAASFYTTLDTLGRHEKACSTRADELRRIIEKEIKPRLRTAEAEITRLTDEIDQVTGNIRDKNRAIQILSDALRQEGDRITIMTKGTETSRTRAFVLEKIGKAEADLKPIEGQREKLENRLQEARNLRDALRKTDENLGSMINRLETGMMSLLRNFLLGVHSREIVRQRERQAAMLLSEKHEIEVRYAAELERPRTCSGDYCRKIHPHGFQASAVHLFNREFDIDAFTAGQFGEHKGQLTQRIKINGNGGTEAVFTANSELLINLLVPEVLAMFDKDPHLILCELCVRSLRAQYEEDLRKAQAAHLRGEQNVKFPINQRFFPLAVTITGIPELFRRKVLGGGGNKDKNDDKTKGGPSRGKAWADQPLPPITSPQAADMEDRILESTEQGNTQLQILREDHNKLLHAYQSTLQRNNDLELIVRQHLPQKEEDENAPISEARRRYEQAKAHHELKVAEIEQRLHQAKLRTKQLRRRADEIEEARARLDLEEIKISNELSSLERKEFEIKGELALAQSVLDTAKTLSEEQLAEAAYTAAVQHTARKRSEWLRIESRQDAEERERRRLLAKRDRDRRAAREAEAKKAATDLETLKQQTEKDAVEVARAEAEVRELEAKLSLSALQLEIAQKAEALGKYQLRRRDQLSNEAAEGGSNAEELMQQALSEELAGNKKIEDAPKEIARLTKLRDDLQKALVAKQAEARAKRDQQASRKAAAQQQTAPASDANSAPPADAQVEPST